MLKDPLTLGRPDNVQIVFGRKITAATPGRLCTRIVSPGVHPQLHAYYKHSKVKQYFKHGRALRTETVNQRPQRLRRGPESERHQLAGADAHRAMRPTNGSYALSLRRARARPTRPRSSGSCHRRSKTARTAHIPTYTARQMTYDLRRLRRKGLIRRVPGSQRYELTDHGRRTAVFFTKTYTRILTPSLTELDPTLPDDIAQRSPLARAWRAFEKALDQRITDTALKPT